jgi:hypothetical protein
MELALDRLMSWQHAGKSPALIGAGGMLALCFLIFNGLRIMLYLPQLRSCWTDRHGCPTINLWTWCSWIGANLSTALYMWIFLGDCWGLLLNLGNASMCLATVAVTLMKRRTHARVAGHAEGPALPA